MVGDAYFRDLYAEVGAAIDTPQPQYSMTVAVNLDTFVATNANDAQRGERDGVCEDANVSPATPVSRLVPPALTFPRPASPFACTPSVFQMPLVGHAIAHHPAASRAHARALSSLLCADALVARLATMKRDVMGALGLLQGSPHRSQAAENALRDAVPT